MSYRDSGKNVLAKKVLQQALDLQQGKIQDIKKVMEEVKLTEAEDLAYRFDVD
jgi:hypothetical protein